MYLFILVFSVYLITLCPTIYVGDSALLSAAAFSIGTAHPPGYPLFVILGKLMTFLPFGNVAFKVNIVSSVFGALSAVVVSRAVLYLTGNRFAAWSAALFLAFVPVFWMQSVIAKGGVYTLNAFICSVIFLLTVKMIKEEGSFYKQSFLLAFLLGLGLSNHHTSPLMGLAAAPVFLMRWRQIGFRWFVLAALFLIAGISVNLLIYIRSRVAVTSGIDFIYSYGGSLDALIGTFLRRQYNVDTVTALKVTSGLASTFFLSASRVIKDIILPNIKYTGLPFVLLGLYGNLKDKRIFIYLVLLLFLWIILLGNVTAGANLSEEDIEVISVYYIPLFSILSIIFGSGIALILEKVDMLRPGSSIPKSLASAAIIFPLCLAPQAYGMVSSVKYPVAYTFARDMLTVLPVKSMLLHYNDNPTFTTFYIQAIERYRDDVLVMNAGGKKDNYGLETSPKWKYGILYPEFYLAQKTKISYLDREFALKGKLYTSNPKDMTEVIRNHYAFKIQPLTALLYPKKLVPDEKKTDDLFLGAYNFLNYESIRELPYMSDFLVVELVNHYALGLVIYGDTMNRRGEKEIGQKAMQESFTLGDPKSFLGPYVKDLMVNNRTEEALNFLRDLEKASDERSGSVAHILEYKLLSVTGRKEEADEKYRYIEEKNLMRMINTRF